MVNTKKMGTKVVIEVLGVVGLAAACTNKVFFPPPHWRELEMHVLVTSTIEC